MPNRREHAKISKSILGELSLGEQFQAIIDAHSKELGPAHRGVDHTLERIQHLCKLYGQVGTAEVLIHLATDYNLIPEWNKRIKKKQIETNSPKKKIERMGRKRS